MWSGVILAPTGKAGDEAKKSLGLKYWYVATPQTLLDGRTSRVRAEPRMLAVDDPGHDSMSVTIVQYSNYLVRLFDGRKPDVWHIRRSQ